MTFAGCGDDPQAHIAKSEYVARSNAICASTEKAAERAFARIVGKGHPTGQRAQRFLAEGVVPAIRRNVAQRAALPTPAGDEEKIRAILAAGWRALAGFERVAADQAQTAALFRGRGPDPSRDFDALSKRYGIAQCAGGS